MKQFSQTENLSKPDLLFCQFIEQMPYPVEVCDSEGTAILVNQAFLEMFGIPSAEMIIEKYNVFHDPLVMDFLDLKDKIKAVYQGQVQVLPEIAIPLEQISTQYRGQKSDMLCHEVTMVPMLNSSGSVQYVVTIWKDITQRKQIEESFRRERDLFSRITEVSPVGIAVVDREGQITFANTRAEEILGLTKNAITQLTYNAPEWHITDFEGHVFPEAQLPFVQVMTTGRPVYDVRHAIEWPDGRRVCLSINATPLLDADEQIDGMVATIEDVTMGVRTEKEIRRAQEQLQSIFRAAPIGIGVVENRVFSFVNQRVLDMLGYSEEELLGKSARMVYPSEEEFRRVGTVKYDQIKEQGIGTIETQFKCKDGKVIDVLLSSCPIDLTNLSLGLTFTAMDITERKRAEKELKEANAELSQYAYVVSHDLQTPLRAIRNYADFLSEDLEDALGDQQQVYLDGLRRAVQEANTLVQDILELSRIGQRQEKSEPIDMGDFIRVLIASLDLSESVDIVMGENWPALTVEPMLLRQVFQNLLSNAVKFNTSPHKKIELGWQALGRDQYEFFVRDNGIGIEPDHLEKIFRVFERLHTKEEFEGTGIGLAIVRKAVGKLGGSIRVKSTPGKGSTFFVGLPKVQKQDG